ncbi:MAG: SRPBCC family protein [Myxococcota bacterium]
MTTSSTDRIEKSVLLRVPPARVWRALTDADEFGAWFGVALTTPFRVGEPTLGRITHPGYEHLTMEVQVVAVEPERRFALEWHPYAVNPDTDYAAEPTTLVEFLLEPVPEGTRLTVIESGFDRLPAARRAEAFRMNEGGWEAQLANVQAHVGG